MDRGTGSDERETGSDEPDGPLGQAVGRLRLVRRRLGNARGPLGCAGVARRARRAAARVLRAWTAPLPQRLPEPGMFQEDVLETVLHTLRIEGLGAHRRVRVESTHDGVQELRSEIG